MRASLLALALCACATSARAEDPVGAFGPLIGCWRGAFEGNDTIHDERCFEPMLGGRYVRDTHEVQPTEYRGETIYFFDVRQGAPAFTYYAADGGMSAGLWHAEQAALVFEAHDYVGADGSTLRMRARWVVEGADRYVATTEVEREGRWQPWGRIIYTRQRTE